VKIFRLDDIWEDLHSLPVIFMKIDCEGCEPRAFRGAKRMLKQRPPLFFLTEVNVPMLRASGVPYHDYLGELRSYGYHLFHDNCFRQEVDEGIQLEEGTLHNFFGRHSSATEIKMLHCDGSNVQPAPRDSEPR